jgi:hypothetical protein
VPKEGFLGPIEPLEWPNVEMKCTFKCTFTFAVIIRGVIAHYSPEFRPMHETGRQ